jgi:integrase
MLRLACCCGLRVSEIAALRLDDVRVGVDRVG